MDFLKEILDDETFKKLEAALNAYNGKEENKEKQVKIGNITTGRYVDKDKLDRIQGLLDGKTTELDSANALIAELKKGTKGDETLQNKITGYETQVTDLQKQLAETRLNAAIKVALLSEKVSDIDYITFKLESKLKDENKALELDDNGNIKDWNNIISGLKTQFPSQFESAGSKRIDENKLDGNSDDKGLTKNDILKMPYSERAKFQSENPTEYETIMNGEK